MKRGRNQRRRQGGQNPNRALDSNGPDVRIRGTANQIYDKYQALARDASSSGDRVKAENYLQHAEHYFRLIKSMQPPASQTPAAVADADGEQPQIEDDKAKRSQPEPEAPEDTSARVDETQEQAPAEEPKPRRRTRATRPAEDDASSEEAAAKSEPEKKPRRKRARRTPQSEESAAPETNDEAVAS